MADGERRLGRRVVNVDKKGRSSTGEDEVRRSGRDFKVDVTVLGSFFWRDFRRVM